MRRKMQGELRKRHLQLHGAGVSMRAASAFALAFLFVAGAAHGQGDDEKARAKEAYKRGLKAHDAKDYPSAARAFAEADTILPSAVALGAALDAAVDADDPVLGAELLERSNRPGSTPALTTSVATAKKKLAGRAGKVRLLCPSGALCRVVIEGRETTTELWLAPGKHLAAVTVDSAMREQTLDVRAGETIVLAPEKAAPSAPLPPPATRPAPSAPAEPPPAPQPAPVVVAPPPPPAAPSHGLPPIVVYIGGGITLLFAGAAVATGLIAKDKHDDFTAQGCDRGPASGCKDIQSSGEPLVLGTNVLLGAAILTGALTALVGIAFTDWHPTAAVLPGGGGYAGLGRSF